MAHLYRIAEVGKGWFSIHETNPDTYRQANPFSKQDAAHELECEKHIC